MRVRHGIASAHVPEGRARALIITDTAMYLVLQTEVFRSEDVGNQWHPIGKGLRTDNPPEGVDPNFRIWDALIVDNTLFVGTKSRAFSVYRRVEKIAGADFNTVSNRWQSLKIDSTSEQSPDQNFGTYMPQFSIQPTSAISGPILHQIRMSTLSN